ncbi:MAG: DUF4136 domain-containing protein [Schleiferiaceae bacterium]|jgi:hypothetical protein|nr:DUF4136 domain-containing protein [Schleiferiaceae bacterium]
MKALRSSILLLATILIFSACSDGITVTSDYDKEVDFTKYKTFGFLPWPQENDAVVNEFDKKRILDATREEFKARGMTEVPGPSGDVAINIFVTAENKTETQAYTNYYNAGYGYYYSPYMGMGTSTTTVRDVNYVVGTIIVDVFEVSGKKLVWQGVGQGVVDESPNARKKDENVDYAMAKILAPYPIKKTSN